MVENVTVEGSGPSEGNDSEAKEGWERRRGVNPAAERVTLCWRNVRRVGRL